MKKTANNQPPWQPQDLWRNPFEVINHRAFDAEVDSGLLNFKTKGPWWEIYDQLNIRLLVSREYEHLLLCLGSSGGRPEISYFPLAHPSGIAVNRESGAVFIASTRNPNQIYKFSSCDGMIERIDIPDTLSAGNIKFNPLLPRSTSFFPGSLYIHDLAVIGQRLYANAVGHNAVVEIGGEGNYEYAWWPKCVDNNRKVVSDANYLQLNSIAPSDSIQDSFFTASCEEIGRVRPGHINFSVDQRGVVFSGQSRQSICKGLTRPHSARIHKDKLWLDNSGYGEFGYVDDGRFHSIIKLPGWTRGLCIKNGIAFVGTSKVIPKFYKYAPGLEVNKSICGIHAVELKSGKLLASIQWPQGNQIFAIEWIPKTLTSGFPLTYRPKKNGKVADELFYKFELAAACETKFAKDAN